MRTVTLGLLVALWMPVCAQAAPTSDKIVVRHAVPTLVTEEIDIFLAADVAVECFGRMVSHARRFGATDPLEDLIGAVAGHCAGKMSEMMTVVEAVRKSTDAGVKYLDDVFLDQLYKKVEKWLKKNK